MYVCRLRQSASLHVLSDLQCSEHWTSSGQTRTYTLDVTRSVQSKISLKIFLKSNKLNMAHSSLTVYNIFILISVWEKARVKTASVKQVEQSEQREDEEAKLLTSPSILRSWWRNKVVAKRCLTHICWISEEGCARDFGVKWPLRCSSKTVPVLLRFVFFCSPWLIFGFYLFSFHFYLTRLVSLRLRISFQGDPASRKNHKAAGKTQFRSTRIYKSAKEKNICGSN